MANKLFVKQKPIQQPRFLASSWPSEGVWSVTKTRDETAAFAVDDKLLFISSYIFVHLRTEKWYVSGRQSDQELNGIQVVRDYSIQEVTLHIDNTEKP